jgi:hypothetical protein
MNAGICTFAWGSLKLQYKLGNHDTLETREKNPKKGEAKHPKSSMSFSILCTILVFDH